jgi:toxin ParE1/3/4
MKHIVFLQEAEAEAAEATAFYNKQQENLGGRFVATIEESLVRIRFNPLLFPFVERDVRRCLVHTFPFGVLFRIVKNEIIVVAIMHLKRNPTYWINRVS